MNTEKRAEPSTVATQALLEAVRGYWATKPVTDQPELTLVRWQVMQLPSGERHFVGYALEEREGRASSAVADFDPTAMRGVTASGRVYELKGKPDWDADAETVWRAWCRINKVESFEDVSHTVWQERLGREGAPDTSV